MSDEPTTLDEIKKHVEGWVKYWESCGLDKTSRDPADAPNVDPEFFIYREAKAWLEKLQRE